MTKNRDQKVIKEKKAANSARTPSLLRSATLRDTTRGRTGQALGWAGFASMAR